MPEKSKSKKRAQIIGKLIGVVFLIIAIALFVTVGKELFHTMELKKQKKEVSAELEILKDENAELISTKTKLEDPAYVTTYARGEYMFSKTDERIFRLPSPQE